METGLYKIEVDGSDYGWPTFRSKKDAIATAKCMTIADNVARSSDVYAHYFNSREIKVWDSTECDYIFDSSEWDGE